MIGSRRDTEPESEQARRRIGVLGAQGSPNLQRLFASLEQAFPVRFEQIDTPEIDTLEIGTLDQERFDGFLSIRSGATSTDPASATDISLTIPTLVLPAEQGRCEKRHSKDAVVDLAADAGLARPLRGTSIPESSVPGEPPFAVPPSSRVLASAGGNPIWWQAGDRGQLHLSAYPPVGLQEGEALREHLRCGRFMALLPLVHFLESLLDARGWTRPPLRASFVIDDPNLHWPSYGFLKYEQLVEQASRHGYHVGFATVPLDGWLVNSRAASLVRGNPAVLSLLIHGNDHTSRELGRLSGDAQAQIVIAQALRRIAALERRSGVGVQRVMAPPHGACSEPALRAMFGLGIEAACISRPYPWRDDLPSPTALAGWQPAEIVAGGLPVLPRYSLDRPREDLVFRALLGQPLVLYGHHGDFSDSLDLFAEAADYVNALGDVHWGPLGEIAGSNYATRRIGESLHVSMYARRIAVDVPEGVRTLNIQIQEPLGGAAWRRLSSPDGPIEMAFKEGLGKAQLTSVEAPGTVELALSPDRPIAPAQVTTPRFRAWPPLRRIVVEARDRIQPLL